MSADADFTMTTPALLKAAEKYQACATFQIIEGGSRRHCAECDWSEEAHIIVALRTALENMQPLPGEGENDWDEEHRHKPRMTSSERAQGLADLGVDTWEDYRCEK